MKAVRGEICRYVACKFELRGRCTRKGPQSHHAGFFAVIPNGDDDGSVLLHDNSGAITDGDSDSISDTDTYNSVNPHPGIIIDSNASDINMVINISNTNMDLGININTNTNARSTTSIYNEASPQIITISDDEDEDMKSFTQDNCPRPEKPVAGPGKTLESQGSPAVSLRSHRQPRPPAQGVPAPEHISLGSEIAPRQYIQFIAQKNQQLKNLLLRNQQNARLLGLRDQTIQDLIFRNNQQAHALAVRDRQVQALSHAHQQACQLVALRDQELRARSEEKQGLVGDFIQVRDTAHQDAANHRLLVEKLREEINALRKENMQLTNVGTSSGGRVGSEGTLTPARDATGRELAKGGGALDLMQVDHDARKTAGGCTDSTHSK
ncbi:hypothetical protein BKA67DRAFT_660817 [Truncatella angustata]|uniref:Uncharacterized protein n=1 Tax=Truncatella angustata TaxID=152316 RepID=A0A9P8UH72_9PEZI|nr:uncharacterized protein BKA67DRAFT_660817 [Truncatella angustata]KAH6652048.1 hypothetical protein BKA67DRAFT_660817 [Truncatella angustata]